MKTLLQLTLCALLCIAPQLLRGDDTPAQSPAELLSTALMKIVELVEPPAGSSARTFSARLEITKAEGLPSALANRSGELALQAPDRLRLSVEVDGHRYTVGRDRQQLWLHASKKHFGVIGSPDTPRFATAPEKKDGSRLGDLKLPVGKDQLALLPLLAKIELGPAETLDNVRCQTLIVSPKPEAVDALKIPVGQIQIALRESDHWPARIAYSDGKKINVELRLHDLQLGEPWPSEKWQLHPQAEDKIETTALSHLTRFIPVILASLDQKIPTLGEAAGERRVVATEGNGRLEVIDGTRVLVLAGTPEEMGHQHGKLMKKQVKDLVERVLYGVGVGSSFEKGRWFFGEIEQAQARLAPFIDTRYLREMDAIALATGCEKEEVRLANFFPELFHCSGFALYGEATVGGKMYHGRILDYMKGIGLEQNAVVIVFKPDQGNAWVNVSYAGFVGSVTAMNEKHVAIGEMGGRGEGNWDGKPMAQLVREVMEKANNIDEAVEIMRKGPRTCEYYYVITDAKTKRAVGIAATSSKFETVWAGQSHPQLPHGIKDTVLMSAGDRYEKLVERVRAGYGKIDASGARDLMKRPVCMNSNIHSVLFEPETLDFWVANADAKNPASHARFTHYNLAELLKGPPVSTSTEK